MSKSRSINPYRGMRCVGMIAMSIGVKLFPPLRVCCVEAEAVEEVIRRVDHESPTIEDVGVGRGETSVD